MLSLIKNEGFYPERVSVDGKTRWSADASPPLQGLKRHYCATGRLAPALRISNSQVLSRTRSLEFSRKTSLTACGACTAITTVAVWAVQEGCNSAELGLICLKTAKTIRLLRESSLKGRKEVRKRNQDRCLTCSCWV